MHLVLLLTGCGCPSFEEMALEVESEAVDEEILRRRIERGIAEFAEWTARDGVCIERIVAREGVRTLAWDGTLVEVDGTHTAATRTIEIDATTTLPDRSVRHELCHALDALEGHSSARPDLFPYEDIPRDTSYGTRGIRAREAFADACEDTPEDLTVLRAAGEGCGEDFLSERRRYLDEVVFPGFPEATPVSVGAPIAPVEWRVVATFGQDDRRLFDIHGDELGLVYLVEAEHPLALGGPRALRIVHQDPQSGAVLRMRELPFDVDPSGWASLVPTDTGGQLVLRRDGMEEALFDPETGARIFTVPDGVGLSGASAVVDGIFYLGVFSGDVGIRGWDLASGVEVEVPTAGLEAFEGRAPSRFVPADGVLEAQIDETWVRLEAGAWTTWVTPGADEGTALGAGKRPFLAYTPIAATQPVTLDLDTGEWTVHPICVDRNDFHPMARLVSAAGRPWFLFPRNDEGVNEIRIAALDLGVSGIDD